MVELTKDILGFETEHKYFISENGNVYSEKTNKILKHDIGRWGYHRVSICGQRFLVHRLVALAFIPNPENKPEVNHKDTDLDNNDVSNLEWVTRKENNRYEPTYSKRVANIKRGEENNFARLSESQVIEIINLIKNSNFTNEDIATMYGVIPRTIRNIKNMKTWKHIPR